MEQVETKLYDVFKDTDFRPATVKVAKNPNKPGGWQVCNSHKHTGGKPGLLLPVVVDVPVDPQFQTTVSMPSDEPTSGGADADGKPRFGQMQQVMTIYQAKGFIGAKEASGLRPPEWIGQLLIENYLREMSTDMRAQKYPPDQIEEKVERQRKYLYELNDVTPPDSDPIDAAASRFGLRADELVSANREESERQGVAETPKGERKQKRKKKGT